MQRCSGWRRQPWVDPDRIAVGGASAGGHFAAAVAQRAHDRKEVKLAYQMLVYPMLDDRTGANGDGAKRIMWTENDNQLAWKWYLNGADPVEAAPARRQDLSGLPPTWIGVGTLDLFYQECLEYGRRLREAGVPGPRGDRPRRVPRVRPPRGQGADIGEILRQPARPAMGRPRRAGG